MTRVFYMLLQSNKSQHTKLTLEKKILPLLLSGFELATFLLGVKRSTNTLFRQPVQVKLNNRVTSFRTEEKRGKSELVG